MKRNKYMRKTITVLCLILMLAWTAAGCENNAGSVSQIGGGNDSSAVTETPEQVAESGQTGDSDQPAESGQTADNNQTAKTPAAETTIDAQEISISDIGAVAVGQTENAEAGTGCTVFISKEGMAAGLDVRGGGPASRESELLDPLAAASSIHAIVLSGGSAYGLGAADGVMKYLEEKNIGYDTGVAKVPLVAQSDLFDLSVGDGSVRPDAKMGYEAARIAMESPNYKDGNFGAGCGATVGKIAGMDTCMKTGIGSYAIKIGDLKIGAVVAVNALGDVYDWKTGKKIAGLLTEHTTADGDSIYAVSIGEVKADQDLVGSLSAVVMSEAIKRAVYSADSAYGFKSAKDLEK